VGRRRKRNGEPVLDSDEIDLAIFQSIQEFPALPLRARAKLLEQRGIKLDASNICRRINRLPETEQVKMARKAFVTLLGVAFQKYAEQIKAGNYQAMRDVAFGTGTLSFTQNVKTGDLPPDEEGLIDELDRYDTKRLRKLGAKLRERASGRGDSRRADSEAIQSDAGVVPGDGTPPNA